MPCFIRLLSSSASALALLLCCQAGAGGEAPAPAIAWKSTWSNQLFEQARREHRFVLLDLEAVWCHWCHVMDQQTYADPRIASLVAAHYVAVKIDQDSDPELSNRYGDWGWPATIVLAPDGSEIVKRRGYLPPQQMAALLGAIVDDPSPGPSVRPELLLAPAVLGRLAPAQREALDTQFAKAYDADHGGWGDGYKFIDAPAMELALERSRLGDAQAASMARRTLDANLKLIDPVWGGVYQYSDEADWSSPHFEKLISFQADDLRLYAMAYAQWHDPSYLRAAQSIRRYLTAFLTGPDGAFFVSQDADLSTQVTGHDYYPLSEPLRRGLGLPRVDQHQYARENGWAIAALSRYSDVSGDGDALKTAQRAAHWVLDQRSLPGGGFRHDAQDRGGPYLGDTVAMGEAFIGLYRSTGDRAWLERALAALDFADRRFRDADAGFDTAVAPSKARGVFARPVRLYEENVALTRLANLAYHYSGDPRWHELAAWGLRYLAAPALVESGRFLPGVLLADAEFGEDPVHITVVGLKADPAAQALHAAALRYPADYLRVDWWDKSEGPPANADVRYPSFPRAAAFACSGHACSSPVFDPGKIEAVVNALNQG
jgi:uncharacterized protein YyaL (SSP411 family)